MRSRWICCLLLCALSLASADPVPWEGPEFPGRGSTGIIGTGDFNADGIGDIAYGIGDAFYWFEGPQFDPDTDEHLIGAGAGTSYGAATADFNGDGWTDFIASDGARSDGPGRLWLYLHPASPVLATDPWQRIEVWSEDVWHQNDVAVADLDGDGRLDVIVRTRSDDLRVVIALQDADIDEWTVRAWPTGETSNTPEGIAAGDLDGDGEVEIILSGVYWDNPGGWRDGEPAEYLIDSAFVGKAVKAAVGDLDNDGAADDVVISKAEGSGDVYVAWYRHEGDPQGGESAWTRTILLDEVTNIHALQVADVDLDGHDDVVAGAAFGSSGLYVYYGREGGTVWTEQVVDASGKAYVLAVDDLDGDGDLDLVGPQVWQDPVALYRNLSDDPPMSDEEPPTAPEGLVADAVGPYEVSLRWEAASDNVGVSVYTVYQDGVAMLQAPGIQARVTGLSPERSYLFEVTASDSADNESAPSLPLTVNTPAAPPLEETLLAWYRLDETVGLAAADETGAYPGVLLGMPRWQPDAGTYAGALVFEHADDRVDLGALTPLGSGLTLAAWVRLDSLDGGGDEARFVSRASGVQADQHDWMLGNYGDGSALRFRLRTAAGGSTNTLVSADGLLSLSAWTHVAATYDGSTMRLYLDAREVAAQTATGAVAATAGLSAALGNQTSGAGDRALRGALDDVYVFSSALSEDQLRQLRDGDLLSVDSDGDGIGDEMDNCREVENAAQRDTDGDGFGNRCDPDLDNDLLVDRDDLLLLREVFRTDDPDADLDGNGVVAFGDLTIMRAYFGLPPGPGASP
ncbi:MAG: LamG-like jellyroll fold domain-containing protein [Pseudomonadota bacterium]